MRLTDVLDQAVFAKDPRIIPANKEGIVGRGLVSIGIGGLGVVFNKNFWKNSQLWVELVYRNKGLIVIDEF